MWNAFESVCHHHRRPQIVTMSSADKAPCWIHSSGELWHTHTHTQTGLLSEAGRPAAIRWIGFLWSAPYDWIKPSSSQMICPSTHTTTARSLPLPTIPKQIWQTIALCLHHMSFINVGEGWGWKRRRRRRQVNQAECCCAPTWTI